MKTEIQSTLARLGFNQPTLIQTKTREAILSGESCIALAKTGTGKTLAYAIPSLEKVKVGEANSLVIFAPTTELAVQIRHAINPFLDELNLKGISLVGAGNRKRQEDNLKKKHPEVIVATPGRFFDFFSSGRIKVNQISTLVIDEADDILEFSKMELLSSLGQNLRSDAQILLFGATESEITRQADELFARNFVLIDVRPDQKTTVKNYFLQVDNTHKLDFIQRLVRLNNFKGILFFDSNQTMMRFAGILAHTKTKFDLLANEFSKQKRAEALHNFKVGHLKLLLATDLAARGLDLTGVTYVINFDIPSEANTYLHRAGRTGRMGANGYVVTLGNDHDFRDLKNLLVNSVELERVYFGKNRLSQKLPLKKAVTAEKEVTETANKKRKSNKKRHRKNKGYHPHYLKKKDQK
ncbi:DEAD/DEAH box helicase [Lactobacillus sp. ESL0233]|uniref:DEAD/DEAH box helicase n=1 Tax=Lactobacillus sp. ESL0233 TaxID=2069354 RepID=UPI000EFBB062|nr:DEAD/DEAH box helicase [Lactobacillus sp. ESL0233]RMC42121.1 DEAD/DEAH box helicase [Lactobacillus sp. ESL0233]